MVRENLEASPRHAKSSLGRLIRISRSTYDDRVSLDEREMLVASLAESSCENVGSVLLDEDIALEGEPWRHRLVSFRERAFHLVAVRRALHHVAVCVSGVAVGASECA